MSQKDIARQQSKCSYIYSFKNCLDSHTHVHPLTLTSCIDKYMKECNDNEMLRVSKDDTLNNLKL